MIEGSDRTENVAFNENVGVVAAPGAHVDHVDAAERDAGARDDAVQQSDDGRRD